MQLRKRILLNEKIEVFNKTGGFCHFCGQKLLLNAKRGDKERWNVDHAVPLERGGKDEISNFLPICRTCNRLRWNFPSEKIRELFRLGMIAYKETLKKSEVGKEISLIYKKQLEKNRQRRKGNLPDEYYN
ncbi:MAG: HNH endonuclease signature motif containing protein [Candidatus Buchananbacteria bacterium]